MLSDISINKEYCIHQGATANHPSSEPSRELRMEKNNNLFTANPLATTASPSGAPRGNSGMNKILALDG